MAAEAGGDEVEVVELATWGASGTALGLTITFEGAAPVQYGEGKPPAGSVILGFAHGSDTDSKVWMQSDWGDPHEVFGYTYRVLNPPELKPKALRVEVRKARTT